MHMHDLLLLGEVKAVCCHLARAYLARYPKRMQLCYRDWYFAGVNRVYQLFND